MNRNEEFDRKNSLRQKLNNLDAFAPDELTIDVNGNLIERPAQDFCQFQFIDPNEHAAEGLSADEIDYESHDYE